MLSLIYAVLPEQQRSKDGAVVRELFEEGLDALYIRRKLRPPDMDYWRANIPEEYQSRLIWPADCLAWHMPFNNGRFHFKESEYLGNDAYLRLPKLAEKYTLSTSVHSADSFAALGGAFDAVFISPVFASLSKSNYPAMPSEERLCILKQSNRAKRIALGGIALPRLQYEMDVLRDFDGIALHSALWDANDTLAYFKGIKALWQNR
ncbi:hypothetical protein ACL9RF_04320 [Sphingobacterium sp. Mn56C]|uniref:hypothetical protein n=1 Tax=Sphingobacterium sp. Mn56C TaxID=3395261 RepID=UPI003BC03E6A